MRSSTSTRMSVCGAATEAPNSSGNARTATTGTRSWRSASPRPRIRQRSRCDLRGPVVGLFDSGVGGLSVLRGVRARLPRPDLIYVADSRHAPYGTKPPEAVRTRSLAITQYLVESCGASLIVVACNTATTHAINHLREVFPEIPFVGMEPGIK